MKPPECDCYKNDVKEVENRMYLIAQGVAMTVPLSIQMHGLCDDTLPYTSLTVITMLLRGVAAERAKSEKKCDKEFEELLTTLVDDIRQRDNILESLLQAHGETKQ